MNELETAQSKTEAKLMPPVPQPPDRDAGAVTRLFNGISEILHPKRDPMFVIFDLVAAHDESVVLTPKELTQAKELQAQWQKFWNAANLELNDVALRKEWARQQEMASKAAAKGLPTPENTAKSFEALEDEFKSSRIAFNDRMLKIAIESEQVCAPIAKRFLAAALSLAKARARQEFEEAKELGIEPNPPAIVTVLQKVIRTLQCREKDFIPTRSVSPKTILFFVENINQ